MKALLGIPELIALITTSLELYCRCDYTD